MADITRLNYFDGQLLGAKDFDDEQTYHLEAVRRHARLFHEAGIAEGLKVTKKGTAVEISPGTAVDGEGRQIVLLEPHPLDVSKHVGKVVWLTIAYDEKKTSSKTGGKPTRVTETPVVKMQSSVSRSDIVLARLRIGATGTVEEIDLSARKEVGVGAARDEPDTVDVPAVADPHGKFDSLELGGARNRWKFTAEARRLDVQPTAGDTAAFRVGSAQGKNWPLQVDVSDSPDSNAVLLAQEGGKVGIGTAEPQVALDVKGATRVGEALDVGGKLDVKGRSHMQSALYVSARPDAVPPTELDEPDQDWPTAGLIAQDKLVVISDRDPPNSDAGIVLRARRKGAGQSYVDFARGDRADKTLRLAAVDETTLTCSGALRAVSVQQACSRTVKQDIESIDAEGCRTLLEKVKAMPLFRYRLRQAGLDAKQRVGVIAEESPSEILDASGRSVNLLELSSMLLAALKAQQAQIEELQAAVAARG